MEGEVLVICTTRGSSFQAGLAGEDTPGIHFPPATTVPTMFNQIPSLVPDSTRVILVIPVNHNPEEVAHQLEVAFSIPIPSLLISTTSQMACYSSGRSTAILLDFTTKGSVVLSVVIEGILLIDYSLVMYFQKDWDQMSEEELATQLHQIILTACNNITKCSVEIPLILGKLQRSIVVYGIEASEFQKVRACHDSVLQSLERDLGKCKIIIPPEATYSAWIGGSITGSLKTSEAMFVTREQFLSQKNHSIDSFYSYLYCTMLICVTSKVEGILKREELKKEFMKNVPKPDGKLNLEDAIIDKFITRNLSEQYAQQAIEAELEQKKKQEIEEQQRKQQEITEREQRRQQEIAQQEQQKKLLLEKQKREQQRKQQEQQSKQQEQQRKQQQQQRTQATPTLTKQTRLVAGSNQSVGCLEGMSSFLYYVCDCLCCCFKSNEYQAVS